MWLWAKQALYCQSDNSKKFVLLLIEKGEMNLVLPVVRHFVRLHGNHKMLLVSKKVLVLPISFEYHWIEIVGNPAQTKRRCNDEKNDTNWQSCEMECKIVGSKVTSIVWSCSLGNVALIIFCLLSSFVACCYQHFTAGKVLDVSICFLSVFYILWEPFISGFSIWHQGIYLQF